jgi:hypothetical protein
MYSTVQASILSLMVIFFRKQLLPDDVLLQSAPADIFFSIPQLKKV